ncbi:A-kinase anchor protein 8-like [Bufo bufo]|uniref:A-kinase anchor protein 8-like n=1 Tax=Bufo bufo TaxID=8384 RepID=UPI001ABDA46E|nr:A-kinase anchor protein 8-like [Bufo bufo]
MNFPRNYRNTSGPRMFSGPRMGAPYFPTYNRSRVHQDFEFAENPDLHGNNFWVGSVSSKDTTRRVFQHGRPRRNKNKPFVPRQLPKVVQKETVGPKNPEEKKMIENPKDATNNPQNHEATGHPQNSGAPGAANKPRPRKMNAFRRRGKKSRAASYYPKNHEATSQPQNSDVTKRAQQPIPGRKPHNPKDGAGKPQQPMPEDVSVNPEDTATNSLQPNPPCVDQPENADDDDQQSEANTQNGDSKKRDAAEMTTDADLPSQPHKKLKTEENGPPAEQVDLVNKYGLRGDTSAMYSCGLCRYHTLDEKLIQIHFLTYKHKMVLKHLRNYLPKNRVNFLNGQLISKMKTSLGQKSNNVNLVRNVFTKISPTHFLHRIEATHCEACGILIPDDPDLLPTHIQSLTHKQNLQVKLENIKTNSITTAKELLQDFERQKQSKMGPHSSKDRAPSSAQGHYSSKYRAGSSSQGHYSSKYRAGSSSQTPSKAIAASSLEILVPEEDDDAEPNGQEFPDNYNEGPIDANKDCDNMVFEPDPMTDGKVKDDETEEEAAEAP